MENEIKEKNQIKESNPKSKEEQKSINKLLEINTEFDESISFSHYCSTYRKFTFEKTNPENDFIPFIMTVEFSYSYSEDLRVTREVDRQSIDTIIGYTKKFSNSKDEKYNKTFLDNIKTFSEIIGIEKTSNILIPALARIVDDSFLLRIHFLKVLLPFIDFLCSNGDEGINILKNNMMNIIQELYNPNNKRDLELYKNEEYQNLLFKNFIKIAKAIIPKDKDKKILGLILAYGYEDEKNIKKFGDEHIILCVKLISELTEVYGKEFTENYLLPQLTYFIDDKNESVRKEVLLGLPNICEVVSFDIINTKVYELIKKLLHVMNPSWLIRKLIVDVLAKIIKTFKSKNTNEENKKIKNKNIDTSAKKFISLIEILSKDKEKYVRYNILEKIGYIIEPLDKNELSIELLKFYERSAIDYYKNKKKNLPSGMDMGVCLAMKKKSQDFDDINSLFNSFKDKNDIEIDEIKKKLNDENMGYYLAYNFPAILYCYGSEHWPKLKPIYIDFCFETDIKIRRSIIASFHEISKITGQTITENELLPIYDTFLGSNNKTEKNLAVRYLPKILMQVDKEKKKKYFKYLEAASIFIDNIGSKVRNFNFINWKNKLDVIEGILCYYNLYDNDIIYKSIFPQCITFCLDDIYKVRITSSKVLATLIDYLYNINYKKEQLFKIIESFAIHKKFQQRINFVKMCKIFLQNKRIYEEKVKSLLLDLVEHEYIRDVKIYLSKILKKIIKNDKILLYKDETIHKICYILLKDNIPVINSIFSDSVIKYDNINYQNEINDNTNKKKEKYFKGNNEYFIKEFKIHLEKKRSIIFLNNNSPNNTNTNNIKINNEDINTNTNINEDKKDNIEDNNKEKEENCEKEVKNEEIEIEKEEQKDIKDNINKEEEENIKNINKIEEKEKEDQNDKQKEEFKEKENQNENQNDFKKEEHKEVEEGDNKNDKLDKESNNKKEEEINDINNKNDNI